jgi:hypothetical protein
MKNPYVSEAQPPTTHRTVPRIFSNNLVRFDKFIPLLILPRPFLFINHLPTVFSVSHSLNDDSNIIDFPLHAYISFYYKQLIRHVFD